MDAQRSELAAAKQAKQQSALQLSGLEQEVATAKETERRLHTELQRCAGRAETAL